MLKVMFSSRRRVAIILIAVFTVNFVLYRFLIPQTQAAELTEASVRLNRMDVSQLASSTDPILIVMKPTSTATEAQSYITFAGGFTVNGTPANITVSTTSLPSTYQGETLTSWPGIGSAATAVSGQNVTVASSDLTPGTLYGYYITGGVTNPSSGGTVEITLNTRTSAPAVIDTKAVAVDIVANDTDQITVTAAVTPTFNFALSGNSIALGDLSTSAVTSGNVTIDIDTNAGNGWIAWAKSATGYLASATTGDHIDSSGTVNDAPTDYSSGIEFYNLDVTVSNGTGSGTPSIDAEYDGDSDTGGTLSTSYEEIAISTGPGDSDGITFNIRAAASVVNESADDYTDTLTVIGAANF
jgi:hypothetical protein